MPSEIQRYFFLLINYFCLFFSGVPRKVFYIVFFFSSVKASIREAAVAALRAALVVTAQRETKETQTSQCYKVNFYSNIFNKVLSASLSQ